MHKSIVFILRIFILFSFRLQGAKEKNNNNNNKVNEEWQPSEQEINGGIGCVCVRAR